MFNKRYDIVYHLSDQDLDGYGSQYLMSLTNEKIVFTNCSIYNIDKELKKIFAKILEKPKLKILLLITDISLNFKQVRIMNEFKRKNNVKSLSFQVLDHHKSNLDVSKSVSWYYFEENRCSALLTANYILNKNHSLSTLKEMKALLYIGNFIDAHDRWLTKNKYHHKANYLSDLMYEERFPKFMENETRELFFYYIKNITEFFKNDKNTIEDLEKKKLDLDLEFLKNKIPENILNNKNIKVKHKFFKYIEMKYAETNNHIYHINNLRVKLCIDMEPRLFQYLSHIHLDENKNIDYMVRINKNGNNCSCSFRSQDHIDVGEISKKYFRGGGHKNASGGSFILENNNVLETFLNIFK